MKKIIWMTNKSNEELLKLGFEDRETCLLFYYDEKLRIAIRKQTNIVKFYNYSSDSLLILNVMINDGVLIPVKNESIKCHKLTLTEAEYQVIKRMRERDEHEEPSGEN